jgi:hypothetical protein
MTEVNDVHLVFGWREEYRRLERGAIYSDCKKYRYLLWRRWSNVRPLVCCMLNPSTATAEKNDNTVAQMENRAKQAGHGGIIVTNLFAYRSTYPAVLWKQDDPVGEDNDDAIKLAASLGGWVMCAWGNDGKKFMRSEIVRHMLSDIPLFALGLTDSGEPRHPRGCEYNSWPYFAINKAALEKSPYPSLECRG